MMQTKKALFLFLCTVLLLTLCSCNKKGDSNIEESKTNTYETADTDTAASDYGDKNNENSDESILLTETAEDLPSNQIKEEPAISESPKPSTSEQKEPAGNKPKDDKTSKPTDKNTNQKEPEKQTGKVELPQCSHSSTVLKNKKDATCDRAGFTGDIYCKKCNTLMSEGSHTQATGHRNTEIRNQRDATTESEGYTGDTYCKDCNKTIATGTTIPKLDNNEGKIELILPDGTHVWVENVEDITGYYMAQKTHTVNHQHLNVEKEILRLCNIEREKVGLQPLTWFEDAYYFTQIRANECFTKFSHTRPNGKTWHSVYFDSGVYMSGHFGENLYTSIGLSPEQVASYAVQNWMNSSGHKANILGKNFRRIAISVVQNNNELMIVQNFFS